MATWQVFNSHKEAVRELVHDFSTNTLKVALTNTAPNLTDTQLTDITQISSTGTYAAAALTSLTSSETGGTYTLAFGADLVFTPSGADYDAMRYLVIYDDTATNDELVAFADYGASYVIPNGEPFTLSAGTIYTDA